MMEELVVGETYWLSSFLNGVLWTCVSGIAVWLARRSLQNLGYNVKSVKELQQANSLDAFFIALYRTLDSLVIVVENLLYKGIALTYSFVFLICSCEGSTPKTKPPKLTPENATIVETKTIYLLRHGESMWNLGINRGWLKADIFYRFAYLFAWEFRLLTARDSVFIDSPLSELGIQQSLATREFIDSLSPHSADGIALQGRDPQKSALLVSSNLRRAMSTVLIACNSRLAQNQGDEVYMHSDLQEKTRNVDGISLSMSQHNMPLSIRERNDRTLNQTKLPLALDACYVSKVNATPNLGNKTLRSRFCDRLESVCHWLFDSETARGHSAVLLGGHSLFFRSLMKDCLPDDFDHPVKTGKISNGGLVRCEMLKLRQGDRVGYYVPPQSFEVLFGKVEAKSIKKKLQTGP